MKHQYLKSFFLLVVFGLLSSSAFSQYYITGQEPAGIHWMQIKTPQFRIVFPKGYDSIGQLYYRLLKASTPHVRTPYLNKVFPITIVLHNESTVSNAFVNPAPFHADFFETPSQEIYPQRWPKQLTLHEYRHVVQMSMMRTGFGKFIHLILGQQGNALQFAGLPLWFIEGDAVYSETIHSHSGRGRTPDFVYPLKAQVLDKKIYPYDKAQFGSYKDFVPDHYTLGYQLVLKGIQHYGINLWKQAILNVARKPYTLFPFSLKLHQITGTGKVKFYRNTLEQLRTKWHEEDQKFHPGKFTTLPTSNRLYASYLFANPTKKGVIYEKSGLDDTHQFVLLTKSGKETRLFTPGFDYNESLSANDSLLVWNEMTFDPRWSNRDYSDLYIRNYRSRKTTRITKKQRLFAPALSPDGKTIVAVRVNEQQQYALDFIDVQTKKTIHSLHTANNLFFLTPQWSSDGKAVVVAVLGDKGKALWEINSGNYQIKKLLPFSFTEMKEPALYKNWLIYTGTYEGKDNLYALNIQNHKTYRIFNARFGARSARFSASGKHLYFSNYTAHGFEPAVMDFDTTRFKPFNISRHYTYPIDKLVRKKTFILDDTVLPRITHPEKRYSKVGHLFNPYSWGPFVLNINSLSFNPGFSILSQNDLSTAVTSVGYEYNRNEETGKWKFSFDYYGWYPVLGINVTTGKRNASILYNNQPDLLRWNETEITAKVMVPLNLNRGKWVRGMQPYFGYDLLLRHMTSTQNLLQLKPKIFTLTYQFYCYNYLKKSLRDIYPRWGQTLLASYRHTPFQSIRETQTTVQSSLYFPGILKHQGISLYGGYEHKNSDNFFQNIIPVPRGYANLYYTNYYTLRTDYVLPVAYPDWNVQGASYLKRIYANVFYDFMKSQQPRSNQFSSTGLAVFTDWNFLSLFPDVSLGVRWNYRINQKSSTFDFLFNVTF
ncbi:MAG: PD40 domain-containing protein [Bacteroidales bacterium]|nr:PD40 domain-containing protein [Bacteroidales bacterium]